MTVLATSLYPGWQSFWDALEEAESPWARSISEEGQEAFQQTVESMIRASVPPVRAARLHKLRSSLHFPDLSHRDHYELRWNLLCYLERSPNDTDDAQVQRILTELTQLHKGSDPIPADTLASTDLQEQMTRFIEELKYTALCTLWQFTCFWSCYTATLPREELDHLRESLFGLTVIELLCQLP